MKQNSNYWQNIILAISIIALFITFYSQNQIKELQLSDYIVFATIVGLVVGIWHLNSKNSKLIEKAAYYDDLTGLPNLLKLKLEMKKVLNENPDKEYAIMKFDLENFKVINELFSYEVGNKVLKAFAKTAENVTEKSFILAKVGVDELIMFSGNGFVANFNEETKYYESIFKNLVPEIENHILSFRYGRYHIEKGETDVNDIINKVTIAHKNAKSCAEYGIREYDNDLKNQLLNRITITNKKEKALANNEFHAFLQPKFDLQTSELTGAEALVRWIESDDKMIYPNDFIPVFEDNGFIVKIDYFILETICKTIRLWIDAGYKTIPISINFSRSHLSNLDLVADVIKMLKKYDIPHDLIEIELTETAVIENVSNTLDTILDEFEKANISVSVDDFGAGYSSLGLIKSIKPNIVKLDKSFLEQSTDTTRGETVVKGIVSLIKSLDAHIVAEGVEEESQVAFLKEINCDTAQGYFYAKPMPISEFEKKYLENN